MKIVCVNCRYHEDIKLAGHEILYLELAAGIYSLPDLLRKKDFLNPDVLIQEEYLGVRVLLQDTHILSCLKIFWAIDTHINMYWQKYYIQLFDIICTPHLSLFKKLHEDFQHKNVYFFPINGSKLPFIPHNKRPFSCQFIGLIDYERRLRRDFVETLKTGNYTIRQNVPYHAMIDFYSMTRVLPNEAIAFELNYRLMEGASCGACVINPDIGEDLTLAFEKDTEVLVYKDGLHLLSLLKEYTNAPEKSEIIGKNARERIHNSHTRKHRVDQLISFFHQQSQTHHEIYFWLTLLALVRNKNIQYPISQLFSQILNCHNPESSFEKILQYTHLLCLTYEHNLDTNPYIDILESTHSPHSLEYLFTYYLLTDKLEKAQVKLQDLHDYYNIEYTKKSDKYQMVLQNIPILKLQRMTCEPGFILGKKHFFPLTVLDYISYAESIDIHCPLAIYTLCDDMDIYQALPHVCLGARARKSLDFPDNWQYRVDLAACYFRCYRIKEGIYELEIALDLAIKQNKKSEALFFIKRQIGDHALTKEETC